MSVQWNPGCVVMCNNYSISGIRGVRGVLGAIFDFVGSPYMNVHIWADHEFVGYCRATISDNALLCNNFRHHTVVQQFQTTHCCATISNNTPLCTNIRQHTTTSDNLRHRTLLHKNIRQQYPTRTSQIKTRIFVHSYNNVKYNDKNISTDVVVFMLEVVCAYIGWYCCDVWDVTREPWLVPRQADPMV